MIDDSEVEYKAKGCNLLSRVLLTLHLPRDTYNSLDNLSKSTVGSSLQSPATFLDRTGYHEVFASTLWHLLTYIPSLTPEPESVTVFESVYEPLYSLASLSTSESNRTKFLDKLMREGVLAPLSHFPTPSTYPNLTCQILNQVSAITALLGIQSVKHLPSLISMLTSIMQDPFVLSHKELPLATMSALQALIQTCWPRIPAHRGAITLGLCVLRQRVEEEGCEPGEREERHDGVLMMNIRRELKETAELLDTVLSQSEINGNWEKEKAELLGADEGLEGFFEEKPDENLNG